MIINITCPNCNFSKKVPQEKIPDGIRYAKCPRCSNTFEILSPDDQETAPLDIEKMDTNNESSPGPETVEFDEPGYFTGLWKALTRVLFSTSDFFSGIEKESGLQNAFAFGILMGSIGAMFSIFWQFLLRYQDISYIAKLIPEPVSMNHIFLGMVIISPLLVLIDVFILAAVLHLFLLILKGATNGFEGTFKVILYSNAASVFKLIPYIGGFIAFIWSLIILVIGMREVHKISTAKSLLALLLPFLLFVIFVTFIITITGYFASQLI